MRLKELRQARSVYQKDIASYLGIDRTTYVKYENGSSEPPLETLMKLCRYFDVTLDYLTGFSDDPRCPSSSGVYNETEEHLLEDFRSLNKQGREYILQTMAMAVTIYKNDTVSDVETVAR